MQAAMIPTPGSTTLQTENLVVLSDGKRDRLVSLQCNLRPRIYQHRKSSLSRSVGIYSARMIVAVLPLYTYLVPINTPIGERVVTHIAAKPRIHATTIFVVVGKLIEWTIKKGRVPKHQSAAVLRHCAIMTRIYIILSSQHFPGVLGPSSQYISIGKH